MTTLIHKCHSSIREFIFIVERLVDHGQVVIVPMVVVDVMLMIGHGIHDKGTFPFQIFTGKAGCDLCSQTTMAATQQRKNIYGDR